MTPAQWNRLKCLFDEALNLPPAEREAFLASTANRNDRSEVVSLLEAYEQDPDFLEEPPASLHTATAPPALEPEHRIGPWVLVREIGRGGMGVVWEARRADQEYDQSVAIKLLAPGLFSARDVARFRDERQILAGLNHPHIARLLDGGTSPQGAPYLVMEYVDGERLDVWSSSRKLPLRERLKLFLSVCAAVEYAHRHLVIHRDLKPGNILVTPEGVPKLLDFGIAKLLNAESGLAPDRTSTVGLMLTPEYASPEQIRGEPATTATDIYSLGVLLYRLLAGRQPHTFRDDPLETMRAICEQDPPLPSAVAPAVAGTLRGALDAIILQALRKNPEERYPSVRALADDVSAWLEGRPVSAHHRPWWHAPLLYVRRNKALAAAVAAVLLSILIGSAASLWYARQAWRERAHAEARLSQVLGMAHTTVLKLNDALQDLPGSTQARYVLIERSLEYLRELEKTSDRNADLAIEIANGYLHIGEAQGNLGSAHLGRTGAAMASEENARRLAKEVLARYPDDEDAQQILAAADENLARLHDWQGDARLVDTLYREAAAMRQKDAARNPGDRGRSAKALDTAADLLAFSGQGQAALGAYQRTVAEYRKAVAQRPADRIAARRLVNAYHKLADRFKAAEDFPAALACYREAQRLDESWLAAEPNSPQLRVRLSFDLLEAGWVEHHLGRHQTAIELYERALAIQEQLAQADPHDCWMRVEAAKLLNTAAEAYESAGNRPKAIAVLREAVNRLDTSLSKDPTNEDIRAHVGWALSNLGNTYMRARRWDAAAQCHQHAIAVLSKLQPRFEGQHDLNLRREPMLAAAAQSLADCRKHL